MARARILFGGMLVVALSLAWVAHAGGTVYVSNASDATISPFSVSVDGSLTPIACTPASNCATADDPEAEAVSPSGRFLYVATGTPGGVSIFAIGAGGAVSPIACSPPSNCATGGNTFGLAITPSGRFLYVTNSSPMNSVSAFAIGADGTLAPIPCSPATNCNTGDDPAGVAVDPTGRFLYVANDGAASVSIFAIQANGSLVPVSCDPATSCHAGTGPNGVKVSPSGRFLYVTNNSSSGSVSVFAIGADGSLTPVPCSPAANCQTGDSPNDLAISPSGKFVYVTDYATNNVSPFAVAADGTLTPIACSPASNCTTQLGPDGVAIDPAGRFLYAANGSSHSMSVFSVGSDGSLVPVPCDPSTSCKTGLGPNFQSVAIPPDQGPVAAVSSRAQRAGSATFFDARASADSDGAVVRFDWDFGDGTKAPNAGPTPQHVYTAAGNYSASVTVTDEDGCSTAFVFTGQVALCTGGPAATATAAVGVIPARPVVSRLSQSARRWREGNALPKIARKRRLPLGTRFRFTLNEQAAVHFNFTQRKPGRRTGHRCVPATRRNTKRAHCQRTISAGRLTLAAHAGRNTLRFQGRLSRHRKLRPGRYTLVVTATDSSGVRSASRSISFTIVK
jgi:DNA-binding beta-propeller fold protein YncE